MQSFSLRPDGFNALRKQILIRTIPLMLITVTGGIVIGTLDSKKQANDVNVLPFIIPVALLAVGFGLYQGIIRLKALFNSYSLNITNNLVTRQQLNTPTVSMYVSDIREIVKLKNGRFLIRGKDPSDIIAVPAQIDNIVQLEKLLNDIHPITYKTTVSLLDKFPGLAGLLTLALMLAVYTVNNKVVVGLAGSVLVAGMIWSFIKIRQSKHVDSNTRRMSWWILLVVASVIAGTITKLTGLTEW